MMPCHCGGLGGAVSIPDPHVLLGCPQVLIAQRGLHSAAHVQLVIGAPEGEFAASVYHLIHQGHVGVAGGGAGALSASGRNSFITVHLHVVIHPMLKYHRC